MSSSFPLRILLADNNPNSRDHILHIAESHPGMNVIATAQDCRETLALFDSQCPDVALISLSLPERGGVYVTGQLCRDVWEARIVLLAQTMTPETQFQAFSAGAMACLPEAELSTALVPTIEAVGARKSLLPPPIAYRLAQKLSIYTLTPVETAVLDAAAHGKNNGEIAAALALGEAMVRAHLSNILGKLNARSRKEATEIALRHDLLPVS